MLRLRTALLALVTATLSGAAVVPAAAHDESYESVVTISEPEPSLYKGRVKSDFVSCKPGRLVKLFREQGADDQKVGEDRTNRRGRWRIALAGDDYYAKVSRRVLSPGSHRHVCKSDTSPTI